MHSRSYEPEILDEDGCSEEDIRVSLDFMGGINKHLGGISLILDFLKRHAKEDRFTVLDIATGAGDIPHAISRWTEKQGKIAEITAIDTNAHCIAYARRRHGAGSIHYLEHSAFDIAALGEFDFITSSLFFHHLNDEDVVQLLKLMHRHSRRGFVVNDLYRSWVPYIGVLLLASATRKKIVINDGPLSVKRAFREPDLHRYAEAAGLKNFEVRRKPVYRISLASVK